MIAKNANFALLGAAITKARAWVAAASPAEGAHARWPRPPRALWGSLCRLPQPHGSLLRSASWPGRVRLALCSAGVRLAAASEIGGQPLGS